MSDELLTRLAMLEAQQEARAAEAERRAAHLEQHLDELQEEVGGIRRELARYRGAVGALLLAASAIGAFVKMFGVAIKEWANRHL